MRRAAAGGISLRGEVPKREMSEVTYGFDTDEAACVSFVVARCCAVGTSAVRYKVALCASARSEATSTELTYGIFTAV
jgi:hypothetical protein